MFITFTNNVLELEKTPTYVIGSLTHDFSILFLKALIGSINGLVIFIF